MKNIIDDGINIFFALQGEGKSYVTSHKASYEMMNKNGRKVISNFPIIFDRPLTTKQSLINLFLNVVKKNHYTFKFLKLSIIRQKGETLSSLKWEDNYTSMGVKDALVIIDESHDRYTGVYAHELNKGDRKFFSRLRHNGVAVFLMSQSYEDIHPFLLRRLAFVHEVHKKKRLFASKVYDEVEKKDKMVRLPSSFEIYTYRKIKDYINRDAYKLHKKARKTLFRKETIAFTNLIGNAYNTHYFRDMTQEPIYQRWDNFIAGMKNMPAPIITEIPIEQIEKKVNKWIDEEKIKSKKSKSAIRLRDLPKEIQERVMEEYEDEEV